MKAQNKKRGIYIMFSIFISLLAISIVSAGIFDKFKTITGRAEQQPQDISITVAGTNPVVIEYIEDPDTQIPAPAPTEGSTTTITFEVWVTDPDGVADIDDSSVAAEFSRGAVTRVDADNCAWISDLDADTASYSCSIDMQYYDEAGTWNIKISATDFGSGTLVEDTSETFTYLELKAMTISPPALTWPAIIPGSTNQISDNDPTIVTNTGNYDGAISVTALDLVGETTPEVIPANAFTIGLSTGGGPPLEECNAPTTATALITGTTAIIGSDSNPGLGGTEELYYCIPSFSFGIPSQVYSTTAAGDSWYIVY